MTLVPCSYATPSAFEGTADAARIHLTADGRRPVRFNGRVVRQVALLRFALRALGRVIWSADDWTGEGALAERIMDPVVTVHTDRLFVEGFSRDQSVLVRLSLDRSLFETEGEVRTGTTNIDFTAWFWAALGEMRSSRETWLRIDPLGVAVRTMGFGGRFEPKVEVPDEWIRAFLQVQAAMNRPGPRLGVRPVDLVAALRYLGFNRARVSPRALRFELEPGADARLVLEPWEWTVPLVGASHTQVERRVIRTWGRRRLEYLTPLLPFADRVDIHLRGRAMPSFYVVQLPGMTFTLGLSGWSEQSWSRDAGWDVGRSRAGGPELEAALLHRLEAAEACGEAELAEATGSPLAAVGAGLDRLCRSGLVFRDLDTGGYRHRVLFAEPLPEARIHPPDPRMGQAAEWLGSGRVRVTRCEVEENHRTRRWTTPDGPVCRTVVHRDWRVQGTVHDQSGVEVVLNEAGRVLFVTCGCRQFREHRLALGPCAHALALIQATEESRVDGPSSLPSVSGVVGGLPPVGRAVEEGDGETEEEGAGDG